VAEPTGFLAYIVAARELRASNVIRKCLLQYYASNVNEKGQFFKTLLGISLETCIPISTIQRINAEWRQASILTWDSGDTTQANAYQIHLDALRKVRDFNKAASEHRNRLRFEKAAARSKEYRGRLKRVTVKSV
jgi:hypothetical protein